MKDCIKFYYFKLSYDRGICRSSFISIPLFQLCPVDDLPEGGQVGGAAVLVVQVVSVLPNVEGQEGLEAAGDGVAGAGLLGDLQGAVGGGGKPYPAAAEKACAFSFEVCLEGIEGAPLGLDGGFEGAAWCGGIRNGTARPYRRAARGCLSVIDGRHGGPELGEVQVVVEDLAGIVEDSRMPGRSRHDGGSDDDLLQGETFESAARQQFVQIIDIGLKMLSVMERQSVGADGRLQRIGRIRQFY